jgi:plastocyanin
VRRMLTILMLSTVTATLAAGCAGDDAGGAASGGEPAATTAAPVTTRGDAGGGGRGGYGGGGDYGGGGGAGGGQQGAVKIAGFAFGPQTLGAKVGESVTWTNEDGATHTVTADDGAFDSGNLAGGKTFSFAFDTAGTFAYHCNIHRSMTGKVTVTG